jgi:hypothetical protein
LPVVEFGVANALVAKPSWPTAGVLTWTAPQLRQIFLALGLVAPLYALRRLPLGVFYLVCAYAGGLALLAVIGGQAWTRGDGERRSTRPAMVLALISCTAGVLSFVARADARGEWTPPPSVIFGCAFVLQLLVAGLVVRLARHRAPYQVEASPREAAIAFGSVLVVSLVLTPIVERLPGPALVMVVGLVAVRFALLPLRLATEGQRAFWRTAVLFGWSAIVICLQSGTLSRPGGFTVAAAALAVGLVALGALRWSSPGRTVPPALATFAVGSSALAVLAVLVPSEQSAQWLHSYGFRPPAEFSAAGESYRSGNLERWYETQLDPKQAQLAAHRGFTKPVSEWASDQPFGINGHLFGYELAVRIWDRRPDSPDRAAPPADSPCFIEHGTCVLVVLRRSSYRTGDLAPLVL